MLWSLLVLVRSIIFLLYFSFKGDTSEDSEEYLTGNLVMCAVLTMISSSNATKI